EVKPYDVTVEPVFDEHGKVMGVTTAAFDITEYKRAEENARQLAALEERQRLARDLHDSVSQTLFTITMLTQLLPRLWERDPERAMEELGKVTTLGQGAMAEMRTLLLELRPANLAKTSLRDLFSQLVKAALAHVPISIDCAVSITQTLPEDTHIALYRIV